MLKRLRPPGFSLGCYTALYVVGGIGAIALVVTSGEFPWYLGLLIATSIPAALIWFDVRSAGEIFGAIIGLLAAIGAVATIATGFEIRDVAKVAILSHACYASFRWAHEGVDDSAW